MLTAKQEVANKALVEEVHASIRRGEMTAQEAAEVIFADDADELRKEYIHRMAIKIQKAANGEAPRESFFGRLWRWINL